MEFLEPEIKIEFLDCENNPNNDTVTKFKCGEIMFCQNKSDAQICYNLRCLHCNLTFSYLPEFIGHFNEIYPLISILKDEVESMDNAVPAVPNKIPKSRTSELIVDELPPLNTIVVQPKKPKVSPKRKRNRSKSTKLNGSNTSIKTTEIMTTTDETMKNNIIPGAKTQNNSIPKRRECYICKKVYSNPDSLREHMRHLHAEKIFQCTFCDKKFAAKLKHRVHERTHNKTYNFMCNYCGRKFERSNDLNEHIRTHTGETPFKCGYCTKEFKLKGNLVRHERIHTGEKPYNCTFCGKAFPTHQGTRQHEKWNHKELFILAKASGQMKTLKRSYC